MSPRSPRGLLSAVALTLLALVAGGLSVAALSQDHASAPTPGTPYATPMGMLTSSNAPEQTNAPEDPLPRKESTSVDLESTLENAVVVVLGDRHSVTGAPNVWVETVAAEMGWDPVVNLSDPGRGFVKKPPSCELEPCSNFAGTIAVVAQAHPGLVVTFGGTADGDQDLSDAAEEYFSALREALPDAELVAISPVTTDDTAEYWLSMHDRTIRAGVEAVGGTFIDVGQPGVGDGDQLSAAAQDAVTQAILDELS